MKLNIRNETHPLRAVILGIADDMGPALDINPVSKFHMDNGSYPTEAIIKEELLTVQQALESEGIKVYRPENIPNTEQIFVRDIGFVIDETFVVANMKEPVRQKEIKGIETLLDEINPESILRLPKDATIEGGDVVLYNDHIFVGISKRTNNAGFEFIRQAFPHKKVHALPLVVNDDPATNILHLDCAFQPVGTSSAILYEEGFLTTPEIIHELFQPNELIHVNREEKQRMFPNIFSIAPDLVLVEEQFTELIEALQKRGIRSIKTRYSETSKLSGLLRCSTLPLFRHHTTG
ncbi:dimethylarginine dimethylaminohydrolase family protein [Roseivirga misakiensis]|uniref:dimethylarginine dimethylaminohydrolase family protein n=1 Tax=Roseivirga misakiensis TaxID=1563681 RepID=UPI000AD14B25|nr:arginine deiminase family protein [Roseivirga misakiensis]